MKPVCIHTHERVYIYIYRDRERAGCIRGELYVSVHNKSIYMYIHNKSIYIYGPPYDPATP